MRRKVYLLVSVLLISVLLFAGCSKSSAPGAHAAEEGNKEVVSDGKVYELKISHLTTEIDPLHIGYEYLNDILTERTNGRIKVTICGVKRKKTKEIKIKMTKKALIIELINLKPSSLFFLK